MSPIDVIQGKFKEIEKKIDDFKAKQQLPVRFGLEGLQGSLNGVGIGIASFWFNKYMASMPPNPNATPEMKAQMATMAAMQPKTVFASIRNMVILFGVQSTLTAAFKHYRQGKDDDVWNTVGPALGAGVAFAFASGTPEQAPAMGLGFAAFSGLFYQLGEWTGHSPAGKAAADDQFQTSHHILASLKLEKFHKNLRNGQLTDDTIMLWNDAALQECRIPPGPRLLILHHLDQVRKAKRSLPTFPLEVPSNYTVGQQ